MERIGGNALITHPPSQLSGYMVHLAFSILQPKLRLSKGSGFFKWFKRFKKTKKASTTNKKGQPFKQVRRQAGKEKQNEKKKVMTKATTFLHKVNVYL